MTAGIRPFELDDLAAVHGILSRACEVDRFPGFTDFDVQRAVNSLRSTPEGTIVAVEDGAVVGYCTPRHDDLTVDPGHRRRGHGRRLLVEAIALAERLGLPELRLYIPAGETPGQAFADAMHLAYRSSFWLFELAPQVAVAAPAFPSSFVARTFGDWIDLRTYTAFANASFTGHPTPVYWSEEEIAASTRLPDFDPEGILILTPADRPGVPVAFTRTRVRPPEDEDPLPIGEIGLIGVLPEWRGQGLGRELLRWGVAHLRGRGTGRVHLSVEAENDLALGLYERTGFRRIIEWPHWTPTAETPRTT